MGKHFVAMAGLHGCIPAFCSSAESVADAAEMLAQVHDLGKKRTRILRRDMYLELSLRRDGNEYAEIVECDCNDSSVHDDC